MFHRPCVPQRRHFRVVALDLPGHGDGIPLRTRFRLDECADDIAALTQAMGIDRFLAVGYSLGGLVAQLTYRRHAAKVSGLVLCATARSARGSMMDHLVGYALPVVATTMQWNPILQTLDAGVLGEALLGTIDDPAARAWARAQLRRTTFSAAISAIHAGSEFRSHDWIHQIDVPSAVVITTKDQILPPTSQRQLAAAIPGATTLTIDADHGACVNTPELFADVLVEACQTVAAAGP